LPNLTLGVVLGPLVTLLNQGVVYAVASSACGRNPRTVLHIVSAVCLLVVAIAGTGAYRNWRAEGRSTEDEQDGVTSRVRFLALLGMTISGISALLILAQWLAIFTFGPCQRA
jgi:hypothetical protein